MKDDPFAQEYKEAIDADAVCGQCGRVNPEGTLICKGCGNNLRDQRLLRLAADQLLTGEEEAARRNSLLKTGLTVLGILVVIWFAFNAGGIMGLVRPGSATDTAGATDAAPAQPEKFWKLEKSTFEPMVADLKSHFPTESEADTARLNPPSTSSPSGYFALFEKLGTTERFVGAAYAMPQGTEVLFVAQFTDNSELRGHAALGESAALTADWHTSGLQREGKYFAGAGSAIPETDGTYQIVARTTDAAIPRMLQAVAYPMGAR